ncbi:uncharacterized protein LOC131331747 [Rhododendron vialii]|uniref:uncharacterized protein LOC131331747 n=1 Tax=Rhododendron vialii TaxID=182163 RepID=UPI00265E8CBB|nr:uncharacterized protein LOC131331747 [Rhododendron vialii]
MPPHASSSPKSITSLSLSGLKSESAGKISSGEKIMEGEKKPSALSDAACGFLGHERNKFSRNHHGQTGREVPERSRFQGKSLQILYGDSKELVPAIKAARSNDDTGFQFGYSLFQALILRECKETCHPPHATSYMPSSLQH